MRPEVKFLRNINQETKVEMGQVSRLQVVRSVRFAVFLFVSLTHFVKSGFTSSHCVKSGFTSSQEDTTIAFSKHSVFGEGSDCLCFLSLVAKCYCVLSFRMCEQHRFKKLFVQIN